MFPLPPPAPPPPRFFRTEPRRKLSCTFSGPILPLLLLLLPIISRTPDPKRRSGPLSRFSFFFAELINFREERVRGHFFALIFFKAAWHIRLWFSPSKQNAHNNKNHNHDCSQSFFSTILQSCGFYDTTVFHFFIPRLSDTEPPDTNYLRNYYLYEGKTCYSSSQKSASSALTSTWTRAVTDSRNFSLLADCPMI